MTATIPALLQPLKDRLAAANPNGSEWEPLTDPGDRNTAPAWIVDADDLEIRMDATYAAGKVATFVASAPTDQAKLIAAVEAMEALAAAWESRGEHTQESAQGAPEDVQESLYDQGEDMIWSANMIRAALTQALGGGGA